VYIRVFELSDQTKAASHILSLSVTDGQSCVSSVVEHTIIVLPKLTVTVKVTGNGPSNFCVGTPLSVSLTATISTNDLGAFGVEFEPFTWKNGASNVGTSGENPVTVTATGTYTALTSYKIPTTTGHYASSQLASAFTLVGQEIKHDLPIPSVPRITIN
jgi:hypothetical protein